MRKFQLEDLGGCFREDLGYNGNFGRMVSRHPCEVPIIDGVYADERTWEPIARLDGCPDDLLSAADPDLDEIWAQERREQKARSDAMNRELATWEARDEMAFSHADETEDDEFERDEMEEAELLNFYIDGRGFETIAELNEFIGLGDQLHWPDDTWVIFLEDLERNNREFPNPSKPKQSWDAPPRFNGASARNCGRKPRGIQNCRVQIRRARQTKKSEFIFLAEEEAAQQRNHFEQEYAAAREFYQL